MAAHKNKYIILIAGTFISLFWIILFNNKMHNLKKEINKLKIDNNSMIEKRNEEIRFKKIVNSIIEKYKKRMSDVQREVLIKSVLYVGGKYDIDKYLIIKIIAVESNFYRKAKSKAHAKGLMQIMDGTFKEVCKRYGLKNRNIWNISDNIEIGVLYLKDLLIMMGGNLEKALGFYNAGKYWRKYYKEYISKIKKIDKDLIRLKIEIEKEDKCL